MSYKEPVEKLPLALRKNIRDEYTAKQQDLAGQISKLLNGETWTIDINPNLLYAYAEEGSYGHSSLGDCIKAYIEGAIWQLDYFLKSQGHGEEGAAEINTLCSEHVLTMLPDVEKKFSYCGVEIKDGKLVILFREGNLGTNISNALEKLQTAINEASIAAGTDPLSYSARYSIKTDFTPKIEELRLKFVKQLHNDSIQLLPNFEANAAALKGNKDVRDDWEGNFGSFTLKYFEALEYYMNYHKFSEDDLLYEGFAEGAEKGEIHFKVVDSLKGGDSYNEVIVEDGLCLLQTKPATFGTNIDNIGQKIVDIL